MTISNRLTLLKFILAVICIDKRLPKKVIRSFELLGNVSTLDLDKFSSYYHGYKKKDKTKTSFLYFGHFNRTAFFTLLLIFLFSFRAYSNINECAVYFGNKIGKAQFELNHAGIVTVLTGLESKLIHTDDNEPNFDRPFDAFFKQGINYEFPEEIRAFPKDIKADLKELEESWSQPIALDPLPVVLYKGFIFPSNYILRRTRYINIYGMFKYEPIKNLTDLGERLPYIELVGSNNYILHKNGGSKKLLELITENIPQDQTFQLYRGVSKIELELQLIIKRFLENNPDQNLSNKEAQSVKEIIFSLDETEENRHELDLLKKTVLNFDFKNSSRMDFAKTLAGLLSKKIQSSFTTTSLKAASEFQFSKTDVVISYSLPVELLKQLTDKQVYIGIESTYTEIAFIDEPNNQESKLALYKHISGTIRDQ